MKKTITTIFLLTLLIKVQAQTPIASFDADNTSGCMPVSVSFVNNSTPETNATYLWDFGNGESSNIHEPEIIYSEVGLYTISLIVFANETSDTLIITDFIEVFDSITPSFTVLENTIGCSPYLLNFNDTTISDSDIVFWHWDFGDGTISNLESPNHTYNYQNNFSVSLHVIDQNGCEGLLVKDNYISVFKPEANFIASDTTSCEGFLNVDFTNLSEGNLTSNWDFDDGTNSTQENPQHFYETTGIYSPQLIVTEEHGCKDTLIRNNYINIVELNAEFTTNKDTLCPDEIVTFTSNSNLASSYLWDFGDGFSSNDENPTHSYNVPGDYVVILTVESENLCNSSFSKTINIEGVEANFTIEDSFFCEIPQKVIFHNLSTNAETYQWTFKDSVSSSSENPEITYYSEGFFDTELIAISKHGCTNVFKIDSCIEIRIPRAYFTPNDWALPNDLKGCLPLIIDFENKSSYPTENDNITNYQWEFGTGTTSNAENPSYTYTEIGIFSVKLKITTGLGCVSEYGTVAKTGTEQTAVFTSSHTDTICASQTVSFTDLSYDQELINQIYWKFGDGEFSVDQNPTHVYVDTGYMNVEFLVYYNGCPAKMTKDSLLYIKGAVVIADNQNNCDEPYNVSFNSNAINASEYLWDFGDGQTSNQENPIHTYSERGNYVATITSQDDETGCSYTTQTDVAVREAEAKFEISKDRNCINNQIIFNSSSSLDEVISNYGGTSGKYFWTFDDGNQQITSVDSVTHSFIEKGIYNIKLKIKDGLGCEDSIIKIVKIFQPEIDFEANNFFGCMPLNVDFENNTISDTTLVSYLWDFGDGTTSTNVSPNHVYNSFNFYNVKLIATDILGCQNNLEKENYIEAIQPNPDFTSSSLTLCENDATTFECLDTNNIVSFNWDFGNGFTATGYNPEIIYPNSGEFDVYLTVLDSHGCDSTIKISDYISVQSYPAVSFNADSLSSDCYPLIVNFNNTTDNTNISEWFWDFGDEQGSSIIENPTHTFVRPGNFDITLQAITSYGCSNSFVNNNYIQVTGAYAEILVEDTICQNAQTILIASNQSNIHYLKWFAGDGNTSTNDTLLHKYSQRGIKYPVLLLKSDENHTCDKYITIPIFIHGLESNIDLENSNPSGCVPFIANFQGVSDSAVYWQWNFYDENIQYGQNTQHNFLNNGEFITQLITTSSFDCKDTTNILSEIYALPKINISNDTSICAETDITLRAEDGEQYFWSPNTFLDETEISNPTSSPTSNITYIVEVINENNCTNSDSVKISIIQKPVLNIGDTSIVIGEEIIWDIDTTEIDSIIWYPDYGLSCNNCFNPIITPLEPTNYTITYYDKNDCFILTKDVYVDIMKKYSVDVPTAFTPNGDGINDIIYVKGWGVKDLVRFSIFNRYGELVFETTDYQQGWDGRYKGKLQNVETYTYFATVEGYNGKTQTKQETFKLLK